MMSPSHSDALVFFGATGDLAHKKIFPALQAMVKRGHLNVPVIGVAKAGWNLDQLKARAKDSLEKAERPAALRGRRLRRFGDLSEGSQGTWRGRASCPLSGDPSHALRGSGRTTREIRLRQGRAGHRREAIRP